MTDARCFHNTTGLTGTIVATFERTGLGDLDGTWHRVRFDDGAHIDCPATTITVLDDDAEPADPAVVLMGAVYRYMDDVDEIDPDQIIDIVRQAIGSWEPA